MEQEKIKAVKEWKTLTKVKDVESFLGFANFYQQFIQNFSHTAKPLNKLKGKKDWKWKEEHQKVFEKLKEKITSQLVLLLPRREGKFRVEMDVFGHVIGKVLLSRIKEVDLTFFILFSIYFILFLELRLGLE